METLIADCYCTSLWTVWLEVWYIRTSPSQRSHKVLSRPVVMRWMLTCCLLRL